MKLFYTIIVCLVLTVFVRAADSTAISSDTAANDNFQRFSVLPFGAYTEETKIQYGAVFVGKDFACARLPIESAEDRAALRAASPALPRVLLNFKRLAADLFDPDANLDVF